MDALQAGPGAAAVVRCLFGELRGPQVSAEVTLSLASNLRFACNALKNDGAVLEGSDLLVRLLRSVEVRGSRARVRIRARAGNAMDAPSTTVC